MSAEATRDFLPTLRALEPQLSIPLPERLRMLRELEYDLEQCRARYLASGLSEDEAYARALETLAPDLAVLEELGALHASWYEELKRRVGEVRMMAFERGALTLATIATMLVGAGGLLRADVLADPSPFLWPVLGLGALISWTMASKVFDLVVRKDYTTLARGRRLLLGLAGAALGVALVGAFFDLYWLAAALEANPEAAGSRALRWSVQDSVLIALAIVEAMAGAVTWLVLTQWHAALSGARDDVLGLGPGPEPSVV